MEMEVLPVYIIYSPKWEQIEFFFQKTQAKKYLADYRREYRKEIKKYDSEQIEDFDKKLHDVFVLMGDIK